ncbi:4-hydroxyphenylpyruvate dioxygenase-like protein [Gastrophryne carolinensis]
MVSPLLRLSHITLQVSNTEKVLTDLVTKYRFRPFAARGLDSFSPYQVALRNGGVVFVVNEKGSPEDGSLLYDSPIALSSPDMACNISYEVEDVPGLCRRLASEGCQLLVPPREVRDGAGSVLYCVVKSVLGNLSHTLIDRTRYSVPFLPGFQLLPGGKSPDFSDNLTSVDHVTFACPRGATPHVMSWYHRCFGFQHFPLHSGEDPNLGFEISGPQIGLRLTSMEYPGRSEVGKLVMAESLPQEGHNQIDQFLEQHPGGGMQHAGLSTPDIFQATSDLAQSGVVFAGQPPTYYTDPQKKAEILHVGLEPAQLAQFGILLDSSAGEVESDKRVLLQVFAEPLFSKDSFYLELIERRGAQGFGEGNIRALWRSMQDMIEDLSQKKQEKLAPKC